MLHDFETYNDKSALMHCKCDKNSILKNNKVNIYVNIFKYRKNDIVLSSFISRLLVLFKNDMLIYNHSFQ